jgi:sterol desaturase/sphingolipid hydroxylase (fatty acid hydroxylase superfamily)
MIFYLLGLLSYYKLANKAVPWTICLAFFAVVTIPPGTTLMFLVNKHWIFQALAFAGGLFCWTFIEYFIHRFWLHNKNRDHRSVSNHALHHRLTAFIYTPAWKRIAIACLAFLTLLSGILYSNYLYLPAGIIAGYAVYCYVHFWLHQPWAEKRMNRLYRFHVMHHVGSTACCFGVTFTWWDKVFNTVPVTGKSITEKARKFFSKKSMNENGNVSGSMEPNSKVS